MLIGFFSRQYCSMPARPFFFRPGFELPALSAVFEQRHAHVAGSLNQVHRQIDDLPGAGYVRKQLNEIVPLRIARVIEAEE